MNNTTNDDKLNSLYIIENKLIEMWKLILELDDIGLDDSFFDLGGHSLNVIELEVKITFEFQVEVSLTDIFKSVTIRKLACLIAESIRSNNNTAELPMNISMITEAAEEKGYYPLSASQNGVFLLAQHKLAGTTFNLNYIKTIEGNMDIRQLRQAIDKLVARHDVLRTTFEIIDGIPVQKINKKIDFELKYFEVQEGLEKDIIKKFMKPFDLSVAPLFRVGLLKVREEKYILVFIVHHIIFDGSSFNIFEKEISRLYNGESLPKLKIQYKDFAVWQNELVSTKLIDKSRSYWINRFSGDIPVLNMPTDFQRRNNQNFNSGRKKFKIPHETVDKLEKIAKKHNTTLNMLVFSIYTLLLAKYSGQSDIIVGTLTAGRNNQQVNNILGMFVNTIAIRNTISWDKTFISFSDQIKENMLKDYENQDYPFERIIDEISEKLSIERKHSVNPLFDAMLVFHNEINLKNKIEMNGLKVENYHYNSNEQGSTLDIYLDIFISKNNDLNCSLNYNMNLFKASTIERFIAHFINIILQVVQNPQIKLCDINMLSDKEKNQILYEFNNTNSKYPRDKTIFELFEEQVERIPNNIALIHGDKKITYKELNSKANQLANLLRDRGVTANSIVAIMIDRSLEMIVGLMGILKAGGAYMPIDSGYPLDRKSFILKDSKSKILLTTKSLVGNINFDGEIVLLDNEEVYSGQNGNLQKINKPEDLAYVIYTSGSTGKPKGVMIEHHSIVNRLKWMQKKYPICEEDIILQKTPYTFDVSVWEIFWWAIVGAKVCILDPKMEKEPTAIVSAIEKNKVSIVHFVPSMLNVFLEYVQEKEIATSLGSLKIVFASGEALNKEQVQRFNASLNKTNLVNLYGPTEATVDVTYFNCKEDIKNVAIGKPIDNNCIYILDSFNNLQPIGVAGELYIAGVGLANGYLNRPELTNERFISNPFSKGKRMYKTGDLGRWLPDGNIEYLGRIDYQVKIRGYRIELGEIENQLLINPEIKESLVVSKEDVSGNKYLCAYIVANQEVNIENLRQSLQRILPEYMVPSKFIKINKMPLMLNGKIDRKLLPESDENINANSNKYSEPRNEIEIKLANIWSKVLDIESVGIDDDFFKLGGNSLKAIIVISKIHRELNIDISVSEIFSALTIRELAKSILTLEKAEHIPIELVDERKYYPTSFQQKSIYLASKIDSESTNYNINVALVVEGEFIRNKVELSLNKLIERHEALRTSFKVEDGELVQEIHKKVTVDLHYEEVNEHEIEETINKLIKPFDLSYAPLIRAGIIKVSEQLHILFIDIHHIVADGISFNNVIRDFISIYEGKELEALKIQYKEFVTWQEKLIRSGNIAKQEEYWLKSLSGEIPLLNMPLDYKRPSVRSFEGNTIKFNLEKELMDKFRQFCQETNTTYYMVLFATYNILLANYSFQEDIIVGTPILGRTHADFENVVGMFVNTLAVRSYPQGNKSFIDFLEEVKKTLLRAYDNQDYPFQMLLDKLSITNDMGRNPLFDMSFAYQELKYGKKLEQKLKVSNYKYKNKISKFDITLFAGEYKDTISFNLEYCTKLFNENSMNKFIEHYLKILEEVINNRYIKINEIELECLEFDDIQIDDFEFNF